MDESVTEHSSLRGRSRDRRVLALAGPAVVTLAADPLMGLVDTAVVGRLGAAPLGALGLAVAVLATVSWVANFLVFGTTSTVGRALGAGDRMAAGRRVNHAAQVAVGLGVVVGGLLLLAAPGILRALGAVDELVGPGSEYLRVRALGIPLLLLGFVGHGAFRGVADTRTPLVVVALATALNAGLTPWLVFGLGRGIAGAAWATLAAQALTVVLLGLLIGRTRLPLRGHPRPGRRELTAMAVVSRDLVLRTGGLLLGLLVVTSAAARDGAVTAAAHQLLHQTFLVVSFLLDGVAVAVQTLVARALGAGQVAEARALARVAVRWGLGAGVVIGAVLLAGSEVLPRVLSDDPAVLAAVATTWWFLALAQVVNAPVFALDGVLFGAEDLRYLRTWTLLAAVVAGVGAQVALLTGAGLLGLWIAVQAMMVVRLGSLVWRVRGRAWTRTGAGLVTDPD